MITECVFEEAKKKKTREFLETLDPEWEAQSDKLNEKRSVYFVQGHFYGAQGTPKPELTCPFPDPQQLNLVILTFGCRKQLFNEWVNYK